MVCLFSFRKYHRCANGPLNFWQQIQALLKTTIQAAMTPTPYVTLFGRLAEKDASPDPVGYIDTKPSRMTTGSQEKPGWF